MEDQYCEFAESPCLKDLYSKGFDPLSIFNFVVLSPICAIMSLLMIILHLRYKTLRKAPGDIILCISIADFVLALHWMATYWIPNQRDGCECYINGIITVFAGALDFLYNVCFIMYIKQTLRYILTKEKIMKPVYYHVIIIATSLISLTTLILKNDIGQNLFGTCSEKFTCRTEYFSGIAMVITFSLFLIYAFNLYFYVQKLMVENKHIGDHKSLTFLEHYRVYILAITILWAGVMIGFVFNEFAQYHSQDSWFLYYYVIVPLSNTCKVVQSLILNYFRLRQPYVRIAFERFFGFSCFSFYDDEDTQELYKRQYSLEQQLLTQSDEAQFRTSHEKNNSNEGYLSSPMNYNNNMSGRNFKRRPSPKILSMSKNGMFHKSKSDVQSLDNLDDEEELMPHGIVGISRKRELNLTFTILCSILFAEEQASINPPESIEDFQEQQLQSGDDSIISSLNTLSNHHNSLHIEQLQENFKADVDDEKIRTELEHASEELDLAAASIVPTRITSVAPKIFTKLRKGQRLKDSLNLFANREMIHAAKIGDGGKSGEFFFFSADGKLVIKTLPNYEMQNFERLLEHYYVHMTKHQDSYLTRVYGLFKFQWSLDVMGVIVMKNIAELPRDHVLRCYDLKGSRYQRNVIKNTWEFLDESILRRKVMKDDEFVHIEQQLKISEEDKEQFLEQIECDAKFLYKHQLIDYSLIVFKIDKLGHMKQKGLMNMRQQKQLQSCLASMKSIEQDGIYYNVGIIDFLQEYTIQKKLEKNIKKVINLNTQLDTSSQDPQYYYQRFMRFMALITGQQLSERNLKRQETVPTEIEMQTIERVTQFKSDRKSDRAKFKRSVSFDIDYDIKVDKGSKNPSYVSQSSQKSQ